MKLLSFLFLSIVLSVTSYAQVAAITGPSTMCLGSIITLADTTVGGSWTSSSTGIATVGGSSGVVVALSSGVVTISYTVSGVSATHPVTIYPAPGSISGPSSVCSGYSITEIDGSPGGTWSFSPATIATVGVATGVITGVAPGVGTLTYTLSTGCYATASITVGVGVMPITGSSYVCLGDTTTLTDLTTGGTWSSSTPTIASVTPSGIVTGNAVGSTAISYTVSSSCGTISATTNITVNATPGPIAGPTSVCVGGTIALTDATSGGVWTTSSAGILTVGSGTGTATGVVTGMATVSYTIPGNCYSTYNVTVDSLPTIIASAVIGSCNGGIDTLNATGSSAYSWTPSTGLACATCSSTSVATTGTTTYNVTGTNTTGCSSSASVTLDGNRIKGHITFSAAAPSALAMKVWLVQFNSVDSSIVAQDSMLTCLDGGTIPYFQFNDKPTGNYMVKAILLSSIAGTSDYIPTYASSNAHWDSATTVSHTTNADVLDINMIYGTVPAGPGFISGFVVSGAGKATSGEIPAVGMLVFLEDASSHILTYTYTNTSGAYTFTGLAYGTYIIYPTDYKYITTPSAVLTLSAATPSVTAVDFKQHTTLGTITPFVIVTGVGITTSGNLGFNIFPNPTNGKLNIEWSGLTTGNADVIITDMIGREVYKSVIQLSGNDELDLSTLNNGLYFINIRTATTNYCNQIQISK